MKPALVLAAACAVIVALPASAQFRNPEAAIKYRQSVMSVQGFHLGRIGAMVNNRVPFDAKVVAEDAAVLDVIDKLPFIAFVDGSDKGDTKAKPAIWTERAKFNELARKLQDETAKLNAAAKTGNLEQIRPAFGAVAQACKACHDSYQAQ
jgi:cytochrome c556